MSATLGSTPHVPTVVLPDNPSSPFVGDAGNSLDTAIYQTQTSLPNTLPNEVRTLSALVDMNNGQANHFTPTPANLSPTYGSQVILRSSSSLIHPIQAQAWCFSSPSPDTAYSWFPTILRLARASPSIGLAWFWCEAERRNLWSEPEQPALSTDHSCFSRQIGNSRHSSDKYRNRLRHVALSIDGLPHLI